jgi:hypothetical protein
MAWSGGFDCCCDRAPQKLTREEVLELVVLGRDVLRDASYEIRADREVPRPSGAGSFFSCWSFLRTRMNTIRQFSNLFSQI